MSATPHAPSANDDPVWRALSTKLYDAMVYPHEGHTIDPSNVPDNLAKRFAKAVTSNFERELKFVDMTYETARLKDVPITNKVETDPEAYRVRTEGIIDAGSDDEARTYAFRIIRAAIVAAEAMKEMSKKTNKKIKELGLMDVD